MTDDAPQPAPGDGRDPRSGKFTRGNRCGRGNVALRRYGRLQEAVRGALRPADLVEVLRTLHRLAVTGDVQAARVLLDRALGRAPEATGSPAALFDDAPTPRTLGDIVELQQQVVARLASGDVDASTASATIGALDRVRAAIESVDLERRVTALEATREDSAA